MKNYAGVCDNCDGETVIGVEVKLIPFSLRFELRESKVAIGSGAIKSNSAVFRAVCPHCKAYTVLRVGDLRKPLKLLGNS